MLQVLCCPRMTYGPCWPWSYCTAYDDHAKHVRFASNSSESMCSSDVVIL